jgi:pimeloyl-ACP methyl ester carboxylesterase/16S rRNA G966 N2-methylase RsmD
MSRPPAMGDLADARRVNRRQAGPATSKRRADMASVNTPTRTEDARRQLLAGLPVAERRYTLAGIRTAVLEGGEGQPVVLLHGPGEHAPKWLRVIPELAKTHRIIAPDLPGHGASDPVDGTPGVQRALDWLHALIERTCATAPALVGQIVGGAVAARYAARHGDRIRCLVLADTLGLVPFAPAPEFGQALGAFVADPSEEAHDRLWERCAFDLDTLRAGLGERWHWLKAYNLTGARAPELRPTRHALMEAFGLPPIPPDELARTAVPTTLVWGRHDLATPLAVAHAASRERGWPLHVIDGAADDPAIEQPEAFVRVLRDVLARAAERPWDGIAAGYAAHVTPTHGSLAAEGLDRAGLRPGMRMLDVAAGSGSLALAAARGGARVLATDASPAMLALLHERARREGLEVETRVMDGQALELPDAGFDLVGSQFGVMLFPDMPRGLREMARVAKPGGRVLVHAFGDPQRIEFLGFFRQAVRAVRPQFDGPPTDPPPYEFQLADPQRLKTELAAAGLNDVQVVTTTETLAFDSGRALWDWLVSSNPIVERMLARLAVTADERVVITEALDKLVRERAGGAATARLASPVHIGIGTR